MKRARALIAAPAVDKEAAAVTAAAGAGVVVEAAIATAIVAPAATTANQGGDLASSTCVSGRWISVSDREGGPQIRKRQKSDGAKASISILALFIWWAAAERSGDAALDRARPFRSKAPSQPAHSKLFSRGRNNLERQAFTSADDLDFILLPGFHLAQRVSVIINILHFATSHFHDLVTCFQSGLRSRRIVAHAVEFQTVIRIRVIGNRAKIDAKAHPASL